MVQIDNETFSARAEELRAHVENDHGETAVAMMHLRMVGCDAENRSLTFAFPAAPWERNPNGVVHGGLVATMFDTAMGITTYAMTGHITPTVNLNTSFLRPAPGDGTLIVRTKITMCGHAVIYGSAEMWDSSAPEKIVATAQGVFRNLSE